ncbi:hypothetical protein L1987_43483 [Smallanthus sonchifolius]|uniref:Uncharacterized protein n=1 Tax=Smallanthus sonchifolius TaxID=185202 RepID=A0ACB9GLR6_9ASTR|nr:hypothetical protein L1987_43483 [Smallanthus sonchifolius]
MLTPRDPGEISTLTFGKTTTTGATTITVDANPYLKGMHVDKDPVIIAVIEVEEEETRRSAGTEPHITLEFVPKNRERLEYSWRNWTVQKG